MVRDAFVGGQAARLRVLCRQRGDCAVLRARENEEKSDEGVQLATWLSGKGFSGEATLLYDYEQPSAGTFTALCALIALTGFAGIVYNGSGQLALLVQPGARPGLASAGSLAAEVFAFVAGIFGFVSLSQSRFEVLGRLDAELAFGALELESADGTGRRISLAKLRAKEDAKTERVLAIFGEGEELKRALRAAAVYRQRFVTSRILVVSVGERPPSEYGGKWCASALRPEAWQACQADLNTRVGGSAASAATLSWVLIGKRGQINKGGGLGDGLPVFDEILAFAGVRDVLATLPKRAAEAFRGDGRSTAAAEAVMECHDAFYKALIAGDAASMRTLWTAEAVIDLPSDVSRVAWDNVLSSPAEVLDVVDADVVFTDAECQEASVTSIEVCPGSPSLFNEGGPDGKGTLLATKRFRCIDGVWRIVSHQTIPYCKNTVAFQSLRCNCDGCALMKR